MEEKCWSCVYGENNFGLHCLNSFAKDADPYFCEFFTPLSDSYLDDIDKVYNMIEIDY